MRKTKIICTIGPATASYGAIVKLIKAGMNVARLNFSHGDYRFFDKVIGSLKRARKNLGAPVAILQDLQGPKIRISGLKAPLAVKRGDTVIISNNKPAKGCGICIDIKGLYRHVRRGSRILIDDGKIQLQVAEIKRQDIFCSVISGGEIKPRKGVNLPGVKLPISSMTAKDKKDLRFGLSRGVDIICLSFVRSASDMAGLRKKIRSKNKPLLIAKIEKPEAVKQINAILKESDGIMIARGDLAVETGFSRIPTIQKHFVSKANETGKIAIVATQMLESMIENPFPQRAEITDIYNAVLDGADALMLSAETSTGKYPFKAVKAMREISGNAEKENRGANGDISFIKSPHFYESLLSYAAAQLPAYADNPVLAVRTRFIDDISFVSDYRPAADIAAITGDYGLYNKMAILNGVHPVHEPAGNALKAAATVKKKFPRAAHMIYLDFTARGPEKGTVSIYKLIR